MQEAHRCVSALGSSCPDVTLMAPDLVPLCHLCVTVSIYMPWALTHGNFWGLPELRVCCVCVCLEGGQCHKRAVHTETQEPPCFQNGRPCSILKALLRWRGAAATAPSLGHAAFLLSPRGGKCSTSKALQSLRVSVLGTQGNPAAAHASPHGA